MGAQVHYPDDETAYLEAPPYANCRILTNWNLLILATPVICRNSWKP